MDKTAMFSISYGLFALSARTEGFDNACIINTVMQITDEPSLTIAVNKNNFTHDMIISGGAFNLSVLSTANTFEDIKKLGFVSGKNGRKDLSAFERASNGILRLEDCCAYMQCGVTNTVDCSTHTLFIANVLDAVKIGGEPMTYSYYHQKVKPAPEKKKGWRCTICNYVYEGDELPPDFICPICKHPASDFVRVD